MKKLFVFLIGTLMLLFSSTMVCAQTPLEHNGVCITFTVSWGGNQTIGNGMPKSPPQPPTVYLDGHDLLFAQSFGDDVAVELRDPSDNVVYSGDLLAGDQLLQLPSTLTGDYTILLYIGNWVFSGEMNL